MPGNNPYDPRLDLHDLQALGETGLVRRNVEHRELGLDPVGEQVDDLFPVGEPVEKHDRDRAP